MLRSIKNLISYPLPYRVGAFRLLRKLKNKYTNTPYLHRIVFSDVERPDYGYCIYMASLLAKALNYPKISIIELGVAYGDGLVDIENHIKNIKEEINIDFDVFGFDTGTGLPPSTDYRDIQFRWKGGLYEMDRASVEKKIKFSQLVIGDVRETCSTFYDDHPSVAPIGCILFDLDYYSSTVDALKLFDTVHENYLPRVFCCFDDIIGTNEYIGELCAIREFNEANPSKKIAKPYGLFALRQQMWNEKIFVHHDFAHPQYSVGVDSEAADAVDSLNL